MKAKLFAFFSVSIVWLLTANAAVGQTLITPSSNLWEYNGNIGIGVQTPGVWFGATPTFQLYGNRPTISLTPWGAGGLATIQFKGVSTGSEFHLNFVDGSESKLAIGSYQKPGDLFLIKGNGHIGVGVSDPLYPLHVNSRIHISDGWDNTISSSYQGAMHDFIGTYYGWDKDAVYIAGYNKFYNTASGVYTTQRVKIGQNLTVNLQDGSMGINTTNTAGYSLAVNGKVRAKEVKVESGWADFVFEPGYRLRPLSEVEAHIEEHGRLPEVPSAQEVRENGVDLGKTDVLLLQKIEELTLYLLEQDKRIKRLEIENRELKAGQAKKIELNL